jgi:hypothetical protein
MANFIGLYYPFIHFKDEAWLKTIALYWDQVKRIVPKGYPTKDTETVMRLTDELGLIENVPPSPDDEWPVRDEFVTFIDAHAPALRARYGLQNRHLWSIDAIGSKAAPENSDRRLAYVHLAKVWDGLKRTLVDTGLAEIGRGKDENWIGMHPQIANIYMMALAQHMTRGRGWHPITDETLDQLAVSGFSIDRISRALLDDENLAGEEPSPQEIRVLLANLCLENVIPKSVTDVPVEKIIALRKDHETEFTAFQQFVADFKLEAINLAGVTDRKALAEHLELHYQKMVKPRIDEVRKVFKLARVDTATSVLNLNFVVPATIGGVATALGFAADPVLGGIAGFSLGVIPTIQKRREEAEAVLGTPGAWLLRVEEGLKPESFMKWVRQGARQFVLDV